MDKLTDEKVRPLTLDDLGLTPEPERGDAPNATSQAVEEDEEEDEEVIDPDLKLLPETDPILTSVRAALDMGFAGVILSGPPGTGKSWYAKRVAHSITRDQTAVRIVQFHASYQYEDFMVGFVPSEDGTFILEKKTFVELCKAAEKRSEVPHVLLIDEISRCDVARVFGEALTYLEMDKREQEFILASGITLSVPANLIVLATMNPWDKGVDELDIALERRFAQIDMMPSRTELRRLLGEAGAAPDIVDRVERFFSAVQREQNEMVRLGHAYFLNCLDESSARRAWDFRLSPFFKKACRLDKATLDRVTQAWLREFPAPEEPAATVVSAVGQATLGAGGNEPAAGGASGVETPDPPAAPAA